MDSRVRLLITYDVYEDNQQPYYQYVVGEFLPAAQQLGLVLTDAWHTVYGNYPARLLSFVGRDQASVAATLDRDEWRQLEEKLLTFVSDYKRKIVPYRERFQF